MAEHVLVPYDGTPAARTAVRYANEQFPDAELTFVYVMEPMADYGRQRAFPGYTGEDEFRDEREKGEHLLEAVVEEVDGQASIHTTLLAGRPSEAIVEYADDTGVTQIVLGSHGRTGVSRYLLGSTAERVVRRAAVPVTVVRPAEGDR